MGYKISVIIPVFNVEDYIKDALESILKQTIGFEHLEVIMINDCSTDRSGEIIEEYASKYTNFISIHLPENSGTAGKPRNIGIKEATGDYLMFLDPDDLYTDDACEVLYNTIKEENIDIAFAKYIIFSENTQQKVTYNFKDIKEIKVETVEDDPRLLTLPPSIWTKIYKRSFIQENNLLFPLEVLIAEDLAFMVDSFLKANGILFLNNYYCYHYRIRNVKGKESITNNKDKNNLIGAAEGYYETYNILKNDEKEEYFPSIFKPHLEFWADGFIHSNTTKIEKKEVLEKMGFLFEKLKKYDATPQKKYLIPLFNSISNKNYDESILLAEILDDYLKNKQMLQKVQELQKQQEKQLYLKKKQVAELQTFVGYCNYKSKNIISRVKNRITPQGA